MIARTVALASFFLLSMVGCTRNSDDALVAAVHRIAPSVVLLTMKIPPEHKKDKYDEDDEDPWAEAGSWPRRNRRAWPTDAVVAGNRRVAAAVSG